jgi:putative toxin-antitoxin system antitoxin component (TIGR02293 family)
MTQSLLQNPDIPSSARSPTECLLHQDINQLSLPMIYQRIMDGLTIKDVQALVMSCVLQSTTHMMTSALGIPTRALRAHRRDKEDTRLTARQSALAFQYAKLLERSTSVFGTQTFAEEWMGRPCRSLAGNIPLIMVENVIGAQVVDEYLERVEMGVYQ